MRHKQFKGIDDRIYKIKRKPSMEVLQELDIDKQDIIDNNNALIDGYFSHKRKEVFVQDNMSKEDTATTLLHELLHHIAVFMKIELDENQIGQLENGTFLLMKKNKQLFQDIIYHDLD